MTEKIKPRTESKNYNSLEFNGSFLIPGFSIYLLEIEKSTNRYFYIGMTGDSFYPSARAAFHRLSGHLEKGKNSTQNQLWIALSENLMIKNIKELNTINIKMHHFPIDGFNEWSYGNLRHETIKEKRETEEYRQYKIVQEEVAILENDLICNFKKYLINKSNKLGPVEHLDKYESIYSDIKKIINGRLEGI